MTNAIRFAALSLVLVGNAFADDFASAIDQAATAQPVSLSQAREVSAPWTINDYVAVRDAAPQRIVISAGTDRIIEDAARSL
ncbi:MAG: hypothetical protein AAF184_17720 [Pseudomonadota bacterium]